APQVAYLGTTRARSGSSLDASISLRTVRHACARISLQSGAALDADSALRGGVLVGRVAGEAARTVLGEQGAGRPADLADVMAGAVVGADVTELTRAARVRAVAEGEAGHGAGVLRAQRSAAALVVLGAGVAGRLGAEAGAHEAAVAGGALLLRGAGAG